MSSSFKIIKSADVHEEITQVLPLKALEQLSKIKSEVNVTTNAGENLQVWALAQAEETVKRAGDTADEIIYQAQLDSERIKKQAHRDGFQQGSREGYDKGYREGMAKAEEEASAIRSQAADVLAQAEKYRRSTMESLEGEIIELARDIAERLISAQLTLDREVVLSVAAESLRLVADRLNVVLYVNPDELVLVERRMGELKSLLPARGQFQVVSDSAVQLGGCRVETEQGTVDATMETRREALLKALYGKD
ncbi:FliH/SctL family protein [Pelotomaculum propionicicum]|uniref:FliH/SctL family protein n=1 Tax=Pelotomaculum propionicicum TaxID=258475 RepID=UPI003B7F3B6C